MEQYLKLIKPILGNLTENLKAPCKWQIDLTTKINFMSSKDTDEQRLMHCKW